MEFNWAFKGLTVTVSTIAECLRTDCDILGDNKKILPITEVLCTWSATHILFYVRDCAEDGQDRPKRRLYD